MPAREQAVLGAEAGSPGLQLCCKGPSPALLGMRGALKPSQFLSILSLLSTPASVDTEPPSAFAYQGV